MIDKAYRCRLYPNGEQTTLIEKTFGACRWVYNASLEAKSAEWHDRKTNVSSYELMKLLTKVKQVVPWLYEVPNSALQQTIRDLDKAYQNFFRRVKNGEKPGYPKFKSKRNGMQSYRVPFDNGNGVRVIDDRHVKLPKLGKVKCRITQPIEGRILSATVKRVPSGKYYVVPK
jgi:putative transposase